MAPLALHARGIDATVFPPVASTERADLHTDGEVLTPAQAAARVAEWKAEAARIGREEDRSNEVVLSFFDRTGAWSEPYAVAGYDVHRFDLAHGDDLMEFFPSGPIMRLQDAGKKIVGVLAAPPCTSFSSSGARFWKDQHDRADEALVERKYGSRAARYHARPVDVALTLVAVTEALIELAAPSLFFAVENPIGRIRTVAGLPLPLLSFDPCHYGDPYTKRTQLWGDFNPYLPTAPVRPTAGSLVAKLHGANAAQKDRRSATPEGFAYAFFMANPPRC